LLTPIWIFSKGTLHRFPSGGTELGEKIKDHAVENINAMQGLAKRLRSEAF
jgi:hypothetical protein